MSQHRAPIDERTETLLLDQAIAGLDAADEAELRRLLDADPDPLANPYMETAALIQLGGLARAGRDRSSTASAGLDRMPPNLRDKVLASVESAAQTPARATAGADVVSIDSARPAEARRESQAGFGLRDLGWAVAAAFAVALFVVRVDAPPSEPAELRAALLNAADDARVVPWAAPADPRYAGVTGDVVWSDARQEGYLRLAGLPANDPARAQYQLWIVDPERSPQPVDGGVFDMPAGQAEVVIPIAAKLAVDDPAAFAITLEQPGGVVVSAGPLLVVAPAAG